MQNKNKPSRIEFILTLVVIVLAVIAVLLVAGEWVAVLWDLIPVRLEG